MSISYIQKLVLKNIVLFFELLFIDFVWPHPNNIPLVYGILVPQLGIEPISPELEVQSLNHWTAREFPPKNIAFKWKPNYQQIFPN